MNLSLIKSLLTAIAFCFISITHGQEDDSILLKIQLENYKPGDTLPYDTKPYWHHFEKMITSTDGKIYNRGTKDTLFLSKKELEYILIQYKTLINDTINFSSVPNTLKIEKQNMGIYFTKKNKEKKKLLDNYIQNNGKEKAREILLNHETYIFSFSKPIFIRNNTYCIIYYTEYCGNCGYTAISVLKNTEGEWTEYIKMHIGDF